MNNTDVIRAERLYSLGRLAGPHDVGVDLEDFGVVKFYPIDDKLFIVFDVVDDNMEGFMTHTSPAEESEFSINEYALANYNRYLETILNDITMYIHQSAQADRMFEETIFVGGGVGGCIATLVATKSTPHKVITFGMPNFCSGEVYRLLQENVDGRNERLLENGYGDRIKDFEFYNFQSVYELYTRWQINSPYVALGDVYWNDRNGVTRKNPSWLRRLWDEAQTQATTHPIITRYTDWVE